MEIQLTPIALVRNVRKEPSDDYWAEIVSEIELAGHVPTEAFDGLEDFSHLEIIFYFNQVGSVDFVFADHPRGNRAYPRVGIFSQRKKDRPNHIGLSCVQLLERKGRIIRVKYLDAIDGTPILDIKPVFRGFLPKGEIREPNWVVDLMKNYWT